MQPEVPSYESLAPGVRFAGRYELIRTLGQGGFAKVFLADDLTLEIPVALKVLNPLLSRDERQLKRFKREVIVTRSITHKNVCKIYDIGQVGEMAYLTMEYIDGQELFNLLMKRKAFPIKLGLNLGYQIASALDAAHREGVVHRDLKPHNVIIDRKGTAKILDFGIARFMDTTGVTDSGTMMGTPNYMSPEQCRGEQGDARSDLYSFGVLMYQIFTGTRPFAADTPLGVLYLHLHTAPKPPLEVKPNLPPALNDLILKCMAKEPENRYQSARALIKDMQALSRQSAGGPVSYARDETPPGSAATGMALSGTPSGMLGAIRPEPTPRGSAAPDKTVPTISAGKPADDELDDLEDFEPMPPAAQKPAPAPAAPRPAAPARPAGSDDESEETDAQRQEATKPTAIETAEEPLDSDELDEANPTSRGLVLALAGIGAALVLTLTIFGPELLRELRKMAGAPARPAATATPMEEESSVPAILELSPIPEDTPSRTPERRAAPTVPASGMQTPAAAAMDPARARAALRAALASLLPKPSSATRSPLAAQPPTSTPMPAAPPPTPTAPPPTPTAPPPTPTVPPPTPTAPPPTPTAPPPTPTVPPPTPTSPPPTPRPSRTSPPPRPSPTSPPRMTPTPRPAPTQKPTRPRPAASTPVDSSAGTADILLSGVPSDTTVCVDSRIWQDSKQGFSVLLKGVSTGPHSLSFASRERGSAEKNVQILGSDNPPIKLHSSDWKPPRYRVTLKTNAERLDLEKPVGVQEKIQLAAASEVISVELKLAATELWIRRADGRELKKLCAWPDTAVCGTLPPLNCGTVPLQ